MKAGDFKVRKNYEGKNWEDGFLLEIGGRGGGERIQNGWHGPGGIIGVLYTQEKDHPPYEKNPSPSINRVLKYVTTLAITMSITRNVHLSGTRPTSRDVLKWPVSTTKMRYH